MMDSSIGTNNVEFKRAKLPRKRKKAAIKAQGRKWYCDTIKLHNICVEQGTCMEKVCKFWKNDSLKPKPFIVQGQPRLIPVATKYW